MESSMDSQSMDSGLPTAFAERMKQMIKEEWEEFLQGYNSCNYRALRFNRRKKNLRQEDQEKVLRTLGIQDPVPVPWAEDAWYYEEEIRPGRHPYHDMGIYYIQEPSAMSAASLLWPEPGERILDLCAAPGGKSTQLASLLGPEGLLISNEIVPNRSRILASNIERMGIDNCIVTNEDGKDLRYHFPEYFHRILVDAPCSGEGMFRKNEEAREEWSPENVEMCAERQLEILGYAAEMLMPGGTMVYSTCTFAPAENEMCMHRFLQDHPEFSLIERSCPWFSAGDPALAEGDERVKMSFRLWPHKLHGEGHYVAVLRKSGTYILTDEPAVEIDPRTAKGKKSKNNKKNRAVNSGPDKKQMELLESFLKETVTEETARWLLGARLILFGDQLYRLPVDSPELKGLHIQRAGLHIGTFLKNRMEPSHALALWLGKEQAKQVLELNSEENPDAVDAYFRGETLNGDAGKGWCLICVDGYSAGWGKASGGQVKNHYPKGLRHMK